MSSGWRPTYFRTRTTRITKCTTSLTTLGMFSQLTDCLLIHNGLIERNLMMISDAGCICIRAFRHCQAIMLSFSRIFQVVEFPSQSGAFWCYYHYLRWHRQFEYVIICLRYTYSLWMSGNLFQTLHKRNLTMNAVGLRRNRAGGWSHLSFVFSSFSFCFDC